ncbi:hypothetical protein [Porphyromonas pogonae]|uniref:NigD1/NigD2 family lipoprotein n=1 Tax=Porphyromonas pogonae TaxID=867595 RepID=UPI002E78FA08|nr:NigD-like C-terminal domain-containing protein [Porphyromonas pogonae]
MKSFKTTKLLLSLLACVMAWGLTSCNEDSPTYEPTYYSTTTLKPQVDNPGKFFFLTDAGKKLLPVNTTFPGIENPQQNKRYYIALKKLDSTAVGYDAVVNIERGVEIPIKDVVLFKEGMEDELGKDKVYIPNNEFLGYTPPMWVTDNYITIAYALISSGDLKNHIVNLVYDKKYDTNEGYVTLRMTHKALSTSTADMRGPFLTSFKTDPIKELLKGKKGIKIMAWRSPSSSEMTTFTIELKNNN